MYWYNDQTTCISCGNVLSIEFKITYFIRHGIIRSPYLFNIKVDPLGEQLKMCNVYVA